MSEFFSEIIREQTERALWEMENLIACIPDALWDKRYDEIPMWKYVYHTLYSLDRWYINPDDPNYQPPDFHQVALADLNVVPDSESVSKEQMHVYYESIQQKIRAYTQALTDEALEQRPESCDITRFHLILGQFRHWHRHMGLVYGFLIADTGKWPFVLNMMGQVPEKPVPVYYGDANVTVPPR